MGRGLSRKRRSALDIGHRLAYRWGPISGHTISCIRQSSLTRLHPLFITLTISYPSTLSAAASAIPSMPLEDTIRSAYELECRHLNKISTIVRMFYHQQPQSVGAEFPIPPINFLRTPRNACILYKYIECNKKRARGSLWIDFPAPVGKSRSLNLGHYSSIDLPDCQARFDRN